MDVDPKRTALVLIEYQNDFTTEGGTLHDAVVEELLIRATRMPVQRKMAVRTPAKIL